MHGLIRSYLDRARRYSNLRLIVELALIGAVLSVAVLLFWSVCFGVPGAQADDPSQGSALDDLAPLQLFFLAVIIAPLWETLVFQWGWILLAGNFIRQRSFLIWSSALIFSAIHVPFGPVPDISQLFLKIPVALILAWACCFKLEHSKWSGFWVTAAIHAVFNGLFVLPVVLAAAFGG